jgi:hypothetical protein
MEAEGSLPQSQVSATCPIPEPDQSNPCPHPTAWRSILILSSHLCLGLPSGLFPLGFPTKTLYAPLLFSTFYMPRASHSSRFNHPNNFGWGVQILKLIIMYFSPLPCYLGPLRPQYSPQHPILKHPQPMFLSQGERPCFTLLQNNGQNYKFCISSFYIKTKDSAAHDSKHPWLQSALNFFLSTTVIR